MDYVNSALLKPLVQNRRPQFPHLKDLPICSEANNNLYTKLLLREISPNGISLDYNRMRSIYQSVVPNYTEPHVQVPSGYLRKFTPDGNQLLGFSSDQKSVIIYDYMGAGAAQKLYGTEFNIDDVRMQIFTSFFHVRHTVHIPNSQENLNRECSLFTKCGNFVIVGSSVPLQDEPYPHMFDVYRNSESLSSNGRFQLEDYTLYAIDMRGGLVSDYKSFKCDKIYLSHNQGVSMCDSTLAVLSVQQQTIYLYQIEGGAFIHMHDVGRFCHPDGLLVYSYADFHASTNLDSSSWPFHDKWFNSLKHRLLCWLLRHAERCSSPSDRSPVTAFFTNIETYIGMKLWKMQLLSMNHLLLKYAGEEVVTLKMLDPISQPALMAIYNIETTEFQAVFENTSDDLLNVYENFADSFRVPVSHPLSFNVSSVSNDAYARTLHMKFKRTITNARFGGKTEATRRLLGQLPISSQCHSSSPYLDMALFSYDEKWVSSLERPKNVADGPVR